MTSKRMFPAPSDAGESSSNKRKRKEPADDGSVLRPSPYQMRLLWDFDNRCGHRYMGAPLRRCSSIEKPDEPGVCKLSEETMSLVMSDIRNMWKRMSVVLEIFSDKNNPEMGYRLRVKENIPIKLSMKQSDMVVIGWMAAIPEGCVSEHVYYRSDTDDNNKYLGGPVSFCNWAPTASSTLIVKQTSHGFGRHQARAETKGGLKGGTELVWDYGKRKMPDFDNDNWHNPECCSTIHAIAKPVYMKKSKSEVFQDLCVLCGAPYRSNSKKSVDRRAQKKVHFINSHIDFLGSEWNGLGTFDKNEYQIDYDEALLEAERLNRLLQRLQSNSWKVIPACNVMTVKDLAEDRDTVMNKFRKICGKFRRAGCIVLRGRAAPTCVEDLLPVRPSRWDKLFSDKNKPDRVYAMKESARLANEENLKNSCLQDLMMVLNMDHNGADSSSDEDE